MSGRQNKTIITPDDLIADFENIKISALTSAAKISHTIDDITLGPRSVYRENNKYPNAPTISITVNNNNPKKKEVVDPWNPKVTISTKPEPERHIKIVDFCTAITDKVQIENRKKQKDAHIKEEILARQAVMNEASRKNNENLQNNLSKTIISITKHHRDHEERLIQQVEHEENKSRLHQEKIKQDREKKLKIFDKIRRNNLAFVSGQKTFYNKVKSKDPNKMIYEKCAKCMIEYLERYNKIINSIKTGQITETEEKSSEKLAKDMDNLNLLFDAEYEKVSKQLAEEEQRAKNEAEEKLRITEAATSVVTKPPVLEENITADTVDSSVRAAIVVDGMSQFVAHDRFEYYIRLKQLHEEYTAAVSPLLDDEKLKKYRFDCQKAINIPVNAISAVSPQHLTDKFDKLVAILSGASVKIGDITVSANSHPLGKQYCTLLLAKKFVNQADTMISSNAQAAYPIAACLVALWQKFPDLGKLVLFHMYKECPYLVPYFIPQVEGQTNEEYIRSLGYRYSEGALEKQDMYLKRMTGIARLYSTILITKPRQRETAPNPHNLENGWNWITNILNLDPIPDICSTLILEFLQVAGSTCFKVYGKQFIKLLKCIQSQYFIKLNLVDEGGPKVRLEAFLLKVFKEGKIEQPEGILQFNFW